MAGRRIVVLYAVLATVAVTASGAWFAVSRIESPADAALRTAPPAPSPILVPVEQRVLSSEVITRGTVRFGLPQPISIAPSPLKPGPGLIMTLPLRNAPLKEGDVVLTASGRPVFVLQGELPAYRDLVSGASGNDVRQLQEALKRLGHDPGEADGSYGPGTSAAVAEWYRSGDWDPFGPTRDQQLALRGLERDYNDAVRNKVAADAALASAGLGVAAARASGAHNIRAAGLEAIRPALSGTPSGDRTLAVETERARAEYANTAAEADLSAQVAERALIVLDPRQTDTARAAAEARLAMAKAARERIRREGQLAVQLAERETQITAARAELARSAAHAARLESERAVRAALDAQKLAGIEARMAADRAEQAAAELGVARRLLGFQVPIDEIVFIRSLPVRVEEVTAVVGGAASGTVMSVTDNQLSVDSTLTLDAAPHVKPGMSVALDEQALGVKATGVVETVAGTPGTRGVDGFHIYMGVRVDPTPLRLEGFSVRLTIPIESTKGAVTAVPVSALSLSADGSSRVQTENMDYIKVRPGLAAGGYVEVVPLEGKLVPGQRVVVGYNNPAGQDMK